MVESCLNKDPSLRPNAAQLLQLPLFKSAKKKAHLVQTVLRGLPPLAQRQERRKQPSVYTRTSIDSWDFPMSPTTSVHGPGPRQRFALHSQDSLLLHGQGRHEREHSGEGRKPSERGRVSRTNSRVSIPSVHSASGIASVRSAATSRSHSRAVSWHDSEDDQGIVVGRSGGSGMVSRELVVEPIEELDNDVLQTSPAGEDADENASSGPYSPLAQTPNEEAAPTIAFPDTQHDDPASTTTSSAPLSIPLPTAASIVASQQTDNDQFSPIPEGDSLGVPSSLPQLSSSPSSRSTSTSSASSISLSKAPARPGRTASSSSGKWRKFSFGARAGAGAEAEADGSPGRKKGGMMSGLLKKTASAGGAVVSAVAKTAKS
jgi:serine/threonine-protein kinase OSR1/STK39